MNVIYIYNKKHTKDIEKQYKSVYLQRKRNKTNEVKQIEKYLQIWILKQLQTQAKSL